MAIEATTRDRPQYSGNYRGTVLALLLLVYTVNFIDRTIIGTIGQAIKTDLDLTDTQLGLLQGFAFAILYTTLGIPIARLAERKNRVTIISVCLVIWSGFTALCGMANSFLQLLLFRVGVGVGEAGCSPPAHSLISDYYPAQKRASALAIYSFGIPLGTMFGAMAGGWIAENLSWRLAFVIVGLPGILLAVIVKLVIKEPPRGWSEPVVESATPQDMAVDTSPPPSIGAVAKRLFTKWSFINMTIGVTTASFASYGAGAFAVPYFLRNFGLSFAEAGLIFGAIGGVSAGVGTLLGGFLTDWAGKRNAAWYALVPAIGLAISTPLYVAGYSAATWTTAAMILIIPGVFHYTYLAPTFGVMHNLVEPRMRATATALLFFVLNLIALGGGPVFAGWLIDLFSTQQFTALNLGDFKSLCPGGRAAEGAAAALDMACKASVAKGTQHGQVFTVMLYAWAAVHYALGAIGLAKDLKAARGEA
ncbi:spinster family MFS transporter [Caulobacter sp. NIBR2454]|uniref:spinster family MFS transporter n=1 Tax=Caulobacter sp. NIBR2454 TaxID=3015996 RepID=UPI0022B5F796|nr:MFS transporter [Caulobacter sp. NIBR2454]